VGLALLPPRSLDDSMQKMVASVLAPVANQPGQLICDKSEGGGVGCLMMPSALAQQLAGAQPSASRLARDYDGPLDLRWGMTLAQVHAALDDKLTLVAQADLWARMGLVNLIYRGTFHGLAADDITLGFVDSKLTSATVVLSAASRQTVLARWQTLVDAMVHSDGEPSERHEATGEEAPRSAIWLFRNDVTVQIRAEPDLTDEAKPLHVVWTATHADSAARGAQPSP
jgi:hypothetical protein